ncbi:hypothetical protein HGRIS_008018 [Hohenbuehelia grisea]|uniref:Uncharacterized protein n=1 Tax=Hohenbuehelia grisea TaxID=104357 RepID=A0ABR3J6X6_9AGAR
MPGSAPSTNDEPREKHVVLTADDDERVPAAIRIQRFWRQKNNVTARYMTTDLRWLDAVEHAKLQVHRNAAAEGKNTPRARWRRTVFVAAKLQDGNEDLNLPGPSDEGAALKELETQHWLELVDGLDSGEGKALSLKECPRDQLEKERIMYLSSEQRLNYLVKIDEQGKLRWARNNRFVDTTAGHWKDAGNGQGIIPEDLSLKVEKISAGTRSSSISSQSELQENMATHYVGTVEGKYRWSRTLKKYLTIHGIMNRLLRKTVQRNTWIYVTDKNFNLFVGIKVTGEFQHSSFLSGGLVTSAGLVSVKHGMLHTISPLSGHYRLVPLILIFR